MSKPHAISPRKYSPPAGTDRPSVRNINLHRHTGEAMDTGFEGWHLYTACKLTFTHFYQPNDYRYERFGTGFVAQFPPGDPRFALVVEIEHAAVLAFDRIRFAFRPSRCIYLLNKFAQLTKRFCASLSDCRVPNHLLMRKIGHGTSQTVAKIICPEY
jgi:hypothetical protein